MKERKGFGSRTDFDTFLSGALSARRKQPEEAFSRIELLAVCTALLLLAFLVAPAAVSTKSDSERTMCFNNLRLIGRGMQIWAGDHNQQLPWWLPDIEGGEYPSSGFTRPGNAWLEYAFVSNELVTPKILACPSDVGVKRAENWSQFASSASFRSSALSYPVHLHASADASQTWLSADRNLLAVPQGGCAARVNNTFRTDPAFAEWTNDVVHGVFGHVLLMDGSVDFTSSQRLKELLLLSQVSGNDSMHFLRAR
jgi:hypothetical protein